MQDRKGTRGSPVPQLLASIRSGHWPALALFDLDGTLVDSAPDLTTALNVMLGEAGYPPVRDSQVIQWIGNGMATLVQRALAHAAQVPTGAIDPVELDTSVQRFSAYYAAHCHERTRVYPGVMDLLAFWQRDQRKMAVVTNKPFGFACDILNELNLSGYFLLVTGGDSLPEKKPHPLPLLHACEYFGVPVAQTLMIGDSRHDVRAARAAGMPVCCTDYGYNHGEPVENAQPDVVVSSLAMLLPGT